MSTWLSSISASWRGRRTSPAFGVPKATLSLSTTLSTVPWLVFSLQALALLIFSVVQWNRFDLTIDFSAYYQAWFLIAHGHLMPPETAFSNPLFLRDHYALLMWPLALLYWIYPHGITLLILQDFWAVGTNVVAFFWLRTMVARSTLSAATRRAILALGLLLLVANPWNYWGTAFDFHPYTYGAFCIIIAAYLFYLGRFRLGYIMSALVFLGGDVAATYVVGLGISLFLSSKRTRVAGLWLGFAGIVYFGVLAAIPHVLALGHTVSPIQPSNHFNTSNTFGLYGYLAGPHVSSSLISEMVGILTHPQNIFQALWVHRLNFLANLAPAGLLGIFEPWTLGVPLLVSLEDQLTQGFAFSADFAQNFPIYAFVTVGSISMLLRLLRRAGRWFRPISFVLAAIMALNVVGWGAAWVPAWPAQWINVQRSSSQVLSAILPRIPETQEVVSSQGVMGRFSGRHWVYPLADATVPARTSVVNIIVTPAQGVRLLTVPQEYGRIAFLASSPHAQLVEASHGVWWFKWHAIPLPGHRGWKSLTFSGNASAVPAWALRSSTGTAVLTGPVGQWHVASDGQSGYVAFGDYWRLPRGRYTATVRYSAESLANIEIWNSTGSFLLLRRQIPATTGPVALPVVFTNYRHFPAHVFHGWGPFKATLAVSPRHKWNNIEVRIWSPTGGTIDVYNISVVPKSG